MIPWRRLGFCEAQPPIAPDDDASGAACCVVVTAASFPLLDRLRVLVSGRVMFVAKVYLRPDPEAGVEIAATYPAVSVLPPTSGRQLPERLVDRGAA